MLDLAERQSLERVRTQALVLADAPTLSTLLQADPADGAAEVDGLTPLRVLAVRLLVQRGADLRDRGVSCPAGE